MLNLRRIVLLSFFLSGFAALVYEVVWTQLLTLAFGSSTYAFSLMLAAFFAGLGIGSFAAGKYIDGKNDGVKIFAYIEVGIGLFSLLLLLFFEGIETPLYVFYRMSGSFYLFMASLFFLSFLFMLVPTTLMGATLPVISRIYADKKDSVGKDIGTVFSFNTFGAIFGSFAAGFILVPSIGLAKSAVIASLVNISAGLMVSNFSNKEGRSGFYAIFSVALLLSLYMSSFTVNPLVTGVYKITREPAGELERVYEKEQVVYYGNNAYGTVVVADEGTWRSLWINNKVDASTTPEDMSTQLLLGYLPMFANPGAKKALNIGLGGGFSLGVIEAFNVSAVDVIELNPLVAEATGKYFREFNGNALEDSRVNLIIADARNYLLTSNEKYDVIVSEPSNLWVAGESGLFTKEFYLIVREHLNERGVFSQWIPLYDFSEGDTKVFFKTIKEVFPHATLWISGTDGIIIASMEPVALDYSRIIKMLGQGQRIRKDVYRLSLGFAELSDEYGEMLPEKDLPDAIIKSFAFSDEDMKAYAEGASLHTDDYPVLEFNTARNFLFLKQKSGSVAGIADYIYKNKNGSIPPLSNKEHKENGWLYLDYLGVKIKDNWSGVFSGYRTVGLKSLTPHMEGYYKSASFTNNLSSFLISVQRSKIKIFTDDSEDVRYVKNIYRRAEAKEILLAEHPSFEITEFKKNGHNAYMVKYAEGQRTKAAIGWYCDVNSLVYLMDIDAYSESELMRINEDILCVHE